MCLLPTGTESGMHGVKPYNDFPIFSVALQSFFSTFEKTELVMLTKEKIKKSIDTMPDNFSLDQVLERLILLDKIEEGIKDADEGNVFTYEEVKNKMDKWLK